MSITNYDGFVFFIFSIISLLTLLAYCLLWLAKASETELTRRCESIHSSFSQSLGRKHLIFHHQDDLGGWGCSSVVEYFPKLGPGYAIGTGRKGVGEEKRGRE